MLQVIQRFTNPDYSWSRFVRRIGPLTPSLSRTGERGSENVPLSLEGEGAGEGVSEIW